MATYVVVGKIPGFREGAVVDISAARVAYRLEPDEIDTLRLNLRHLKPLAEEPGQSSPSALGAQPPAA